MGKAVGAHSPPGCRVGGPTGPERVHASMAMAEQGKGITHLLIDHDTTYAASFDAAFEGDGAEVKRVGARAPTASRVVTEECAGKDLRTGRA